MLVTDLDRLNEDIVLSAAESAVFDDFYSRWMADAGPPVDNQDELKISQRIDRHGQPRWYIYNPSTQKTHCFDSEAEVRVWIEQRYSGASR